MGFRSAARPCLHAGFLLMLCAVPTRADNWPPITPEERALAKPRVDRAADAEALFWDVRVEDERIENEWKTTLSHWLRIKVFTEQGKEAASRVDLPFSKDIHIEDIAGRTITADGREVPLKSSDVFERTVIKARGFKVQVKSFVMPAVDVGSIVEYRWTERRVNSLSAYERFQFQRELPVEQVTYHVKPLDLKGTTWEMGVRTFHGATTPFEGEPGGFSAKSSRNVPAYRVEPHMPPEAQVRPWMLLYYTQADPMTTSAQEYWNGYGRRVCEFDDDLLSPSREVRELAGKAVAGATDAREKLDRLYRLCRTSVRNAWVHPEGLSTHDLKALGKISKPDETLDRGFGSGLDILFVFAALARAAGFDAHVVRLCSRADFYFTAEDDDAYFLNALDVAVKDGEQWRFFDPANAVLPCGSIRWQEEGVPALVPGPKESHFVTTPVTPAESSSVRRIAVLTMDDQGSLRGRMRIELTGQEAIEARSALVGETPENREDSVRVWTQDRLAGAAISEVHIAGAEQPDQPLTFTFMVEAKGYAQRTGRRLFLQPAVFQHSVPAWFPAADRRYPIDFHYPWSEQDSVAITLPEGYELDHPDAPAPEDLGNVGTYRVELSAIQGSNVLVYRRAFAMRSWQFGVGQYSGVKGFFDDVGQRDGHSIALRATEAPRDSTGERR